MFLVWNKSFYPNYKAWSLKGSISLCLWQKHKCKLHLDFVSGLQQFVSKQRFNQQVWTFDWLGPRSRLGLDLVLNNQHPHPKLLNDVFVHFKDFKVSCQNHHTGVKVLLLLTLFPKNESLPLPIQWMLKLKASCHWSRLSPFTGTWLGCYRAWGGASRVMFKSHPHPESKPTTQA